MKTDEVPRGDDYGSWTWKQIKAAVCGGSEEHGGDSARKQYADPESLWSAGTKFLRLQRVMELLRDTVRVHSKAIAGPDGPWKGPAAEGFLNTMDYYAKVFQAHVDRVSKPPFGGSGSLPQALVDAGNNLNAAQYQLNAIDIWYAEQAVKLGVKPMSNGLIPVSQKPEIVKLLDQDMRAVIAKLRDEYTVKVPTLTAPAPPAPPSVNGPGGGGPDTVLPSPPPLVPGVPAGPGVTPYAGFKPEGGPGGVDPFPPGGVPGGPGGPPLPPGGPGEVSPFQPGGVSPYQPGGGPGAIPMPKPLGPADLGLGPDRYNPGTALAGGPATMPTTTPPLGGGLEPYRPNAMGAGGPGFGGITPWSAGVGGGFGGGAGGVKPYGTGGIKPYGAGGSLLKGGGASPFGSGDGAGLGGRSGPGSGGPGGKSAAGGPAGGGPGGMPMAPGMGGGGGQGGEQERERTTWLVEDEDVWGANPTIAPGVIGRREPDR